MDGQSQTVDQIPADDRFARFPHHIDSSTHIPPSETDSDIDRSLNGKDRSVVVCAGYFFDRVHWLT